MSSPDLYICHRVSIIIICPTYPLVKAPRVKLSFNSKLSNPSVISSSAFLSTCLYINIIQRYSSHVFLFESLLPSLKVVFCIRRNREILRTENYMRIFSSVIFSSCCILSQYNSPFVSPGLPLLPPQHRQVPHHQGAGEVGQDVHQDLPGAAENAAGE